ncbi:MAG TPA: ABC transporter permease [Anaerolineales bacterium]|nr:ABC transporter permease [Anaerolineales bacterium]
MKKISPNILFKHTRERLVTTGLVVLFLGVWELLARTGKLSFVIFPAPSKILIYFVISLAKGKFTQATVISLSRMFFGFLIGGGSGMILGLILGWSRRLRRILDPIVAALHPIPKLALLPMMLVLLGIGESSRIAMVSISAFFPMLINTIAGVLQINPTYYEVLENCGANKLDIFRKVILPGSLPLVMTGARLSLKSALTTTIGVEMVFGSTGLGAALWLAWETMRITDLYSTLLIVGIIGICTTLLIEGSRRFLIPWHYESHRP